MKQSFCLRASWNVPVCLWGAALSMSFFKVRVHLPCTICVEPWYLPFDAENVLAGPPHDSLYCARHACQHRQWIAGQIARFNTWYIASGHGSVWVHLCFMLHYSAYVSFGAIQRVSLDEIQNRKLQLLESRFKLHAHRTTRVWSKLPEALESTEGPKSPRQLDYPV
jgi:hypothetical protein